METETGKEVLQGKVNVNQITEDLQNEGLKGKEKREKNLIVWKPGQSGNLKGKPKGTKTGIRAQLKRLLRDHGKQAVIDRLQKDNKILEDRSASGVIAEVLIDKSQEGDKDFIKIVLDQTENPLQRNVKIDATLEVTKIERLILEDPEIIEIES